MTARDVLAAIEQRVDRMTTPDPTGQRRYAMSEMGHIAPDTYLTETDRSTDCIAHIAADLRRLVAALRAVLDLHRPMTESEADILDLDAGDCFDCWQETPCDTVREITDALNGVTAGTDQ